MTKGAFAIGGAASLRRRFGHARTRAAPPAHAANRRSYVLHLADGEGQRSAILGCVAFERAGIEVSTAIAFDKSEGHVAVKESVVLPLHFGEDEPWVSSAAGGWGGSRRGTPPFAARQSAGALETGNRRIAWDLTFEPIDASWRQVFARRGGLFAARSPVGATLFPKVLVDGILLVNGQTWRVHRWPGFITAADPGVGGRGAGGETIPRMGDGVWTPQRAARPRKAQSFLHAFLRPASPSQGGCGRDRDRADVNDGGPAPAAATLQAWGRPASFPSLAALHPRLGLVQGAGVILNYGGKSFDLTELRLGGYTEMATTSRRLSFLATSPDIHLEGEAWAETDDFVGVHTRNRAGPDTQNLVTGLARARAELTIRGETTVRLESGSAFLELVPGGTEHGVEMYV